MTTTTVSISISDRVSTAPGGTITATGPGATVTNAGPTITQPPEYVTVTAGNGGYTTVTVEAGTVTVISYRLPTSSSSSFTCRTYATNYLNGLNGRQRRSVFDMDAPVELSEYERMPRPGAVPKP